MSDHEIDLPITALGKGQPVWSLSNLMEAVGAKFSDPAYPGQSEKAIAEAEKGKLGPIPFPYGLSPSQLAELLYVEPTHRACCTLKARSLMANRYRFARLDGEPDDPPDTLRKFLLKLFPAGIEELIYPAALDFESVGNAYIEVIRKLDARFSGGEGQIARLVHVPAFTVRRLPPGHPSGCAFVQQYGDQEVYFREFGMPGPRELKGQGRVNEMIHVKNVGGQSARNYWYGLPDIIAALPAVLGIQRAMEYLTGFLSSKGAPNYFLFIRGGADTPDLFDQPTLNRYFNEAMEKGPGRVVVLSTPSGVEPTLNPLSLQANPMEIVRFIHECRDQIARANQVPLRLLSVLEAGQLGGTGEAVVQLEYFKEFVVRPRQALWENVIYRTVMATNESWIDWTIRFGEMDVEDTLKAMQADTLGVRFGLMSPNEARAKRGLPPVPGGDEVVFLSSGGEPLLLRTILGNRPSTQEGPEDNENKESRTTVQSVICSKDRFKTAEEAAAWCREHGFHTEKIDTTEDSFRFRQFDPSRCQEGSFRTIELTSGVKAVICRPIRGGEQKCGI